MKIRSDYWLVVVLFFNMFIALVVFGEWLAPVRSYVVFTYLLFCPGLSLAYLLPTRDKLTQLFLVMVISVGIDTLVAEIFVYSKNWSPEWILVVLMIVSLVGAASEIFTKFRKPDSRLPGHVRSEL